MVPIAATNPRITTTNEIKRSAVAVPRFIPLADRRLTAGSNASEMKIETRRRRKIALSFWNVFRTINVARKPNQNRPIARGTHLGIFEAIPGCAMLLSVTVRIVVFRQR
jgi:hypothetical protein